MEHSEAADLERKIAEMAEKERISNTKLFQQALKRLKEEWQGQKPKGEQKQE